MSMARHTKRLAYFMVLAMITGGAACNKSQNETSASQEPSTTSPSFSVTPVEEGAAPAPEKKVDSAVAASNAVDKKVAPVAVATPDPGTKAETVAVATPDPGTKAQPVAIASVTTPGDTALPAVAALTSPEKDVEPALAAVAKNKDSIALQKGVIGVYKDIRFVWSRNPKPSPKIRASWEKKWAAVLAQNEEPGVMCDEADLVAASFEKPEKEGEPAFLSMLFRVREPFKRDRGMHIKGYVDQSHRELLPQAQRKNGYAEWSYFPQPATTKWKTLSDSIGGNSYILIRRGVSAEDIPYNLKLAFFKNEKGAKMYEVYGNKVDLGWLVAE